jgi:hypothetical protein
LIGYKYKIHVMVGMVVLSVVLKFLY